MRRFEDEAGTAWVADVRHEEGPDYKGRVYLVLRPEEGGDELPLEDVRWNSERTARRTLETMSVTELRRRLRIARGRTTTPAAY